MSKIFYVKKTKETGIDFFSDVDKEKGRYESGLARERIFYALMLKLGFILDVNKTALKGEYPGFGKGLVPESCKEKFDFSLKLNNCRIYFEVSGTDSLKVNEFSDLFIRDDKISFLREHEGICYFVHVLNNKKVEKPLIRIIKMNDLKKSDYCVRSGERWVFYAIAYNNSNVLSFDEFLMKLKSEFI